MSEKVIREADARVVAAQGKLYRLKTQFYDFRAMELVCEPIVPVTSGGRLVGCGSVYKDAQGDLSVTIFFGYDTPERLSAEAGQPVYIEASTAFGAERPDGSETLEPALTLGILNALAAGKALVFNRLYVQGLELTSIDSGGLEPLKLELP